MKRQTEAGLGLGRWRRAITVLVLALIFGAASQGYALAQQSSSPNYMVSETQFGTGSTPEQCWGSYCSRISTGDLTVGSGNSANYSAQFGFNTTADPLLEVLVVPGDTDMGVLDSGSTGTAYSTLKVRNYLSNGYVVQLTGSSPKMGNRALASMPALGGAAPGTEQFGLNLAANTSPSVGTAPVQVPDNTFSYGTVASGYATPNQFKYVDGDVVARSTTSSGETNYTISMIINISNVTPGGRYTGNLSAVVVPVY